MYIDAKIEELYRQPALSKAQIIPTLHWHSGAGSRHHHRTVTVITVCRLQPQLRWSQPRRWLQVIARIRGVTPRKLLLHCSELRIKILSMQLRCKRLIYYTRTRYVFKNPHSFFVRIIAYPLTNERTAWEHTGRFRRQKVQEQHITENWTKDDVQPSVVSSAAHLVTVPCLPRDLRHATLFISIFTKGVNDIFRNTTFGDGAYQSLLCVQSTYFAFTQKYLNFKRIHLKLGRCAGCASP